MTAGTDGAAPEPELDTEVVECAGVVPWRRARGRRGTPGPLELLLVRSASHGHWGFPKGHREPGEPLPVCAVRETLEETGVEVVLGRPLTVQRYRLPDGRDKTVHLWAGRPLTGADPVAQAAEIADLRWVGADEAAALLHYREDLDVLDLLRGWAADAALDTRPVLVLRHAKARPRAQWSRADADRPLVALGTAQAAALVPLLTCWRPTHLVSSPWKRCAKTLAPYAATVKASVRPKSGLSQDGAARHPAKAARHLERLLERDEASLLCTHRPVLPRLVAALARVCPDGVRQSLPDDDPYLEPAQLLVVHVRRADRGRARIVAVETHRAR